MEMNKAIQGLKEIQQNIQQVQPGIKWNPAEHPTIAFELHCVLKTCGFLIGKC